MLELNIFFFSFLQVFPAGLKIKAGKITAELRVHTVHPVPEISQKGRDWLSLIPYSANSSGLHRKKNLEKQRLCFS